MKDIIKDLMLGNWIWVAISIACVSGSYIDDGGYFTSTPSTWQIVLCVLVITWTVFIIASPVVARNILDKIIK